MTDAEAAALCELLAIAAGPGKAYLHFSDPEHVWCENGVLLDHDTLAHWIHWEVTGSRWYYR